MIKVFTNGFPKAGNHALVKACELLGVPAQVNHLPFGEVLAEAVIAECDYHLFIKRDPRNMLISRVRMDGGSLTQGTIISRLRMYEQESFCVQLAKYEGWLRDSRTLVVKFEDLIASDAEMRRIATYIGVEYLDDAFPNLPGLTITWTGAHSDHNMLWTPAIAQAWEEEGGNELLERWGYAI